MSDKIKRVSPPFVTREPNQLPTKKQPILYVQQFSINVQAAKREAEKNPSSCILIEAIIITRMPPIKELFHLPFNTAPVGQTHMQSRWR